jgi:predicted DNA binding protein
LERETALVELIRDLSNPSRAFRALMGLVQKLDERGASGTPVEAPERRPRQYQHRLTPTERVALVAAYEEGIGVRKLATDFGISRSTVTEQMKRQGVRLHSPALLPEEIEEAAQLYGAGLSLAVIADRLNVATKTVHTALRRMGVPMRDTHGRKRRSSDE